MNLTSVGLDFGNGLVKIAIEGKASKIPAAYSLIKPIGKLNPKTGLRANPKSFSLLFDNQELWFGQDVLSVTNIRELDNLKYIPKHIMILFKAALYRWSTQHRIPIESLGKLCIVSSMPPDLFSDRRKYQESLKAYRQAFNTSKPIYIRTNSDTIRIGTRFIGLKREAISYIEENQARLPGYTLLIDWGYGTVDSGLFLNGNPEPVNISTSNSGLLHTYAEINDINPDEAELDIINNIGRQQIKPHLNDIKNRIVRLQRVLESRGGLSNLVLIGGGTRLMNKEFKSSLRAIAPKIIIKDEFENARNNLKFAQRELKNGLT